MEIRRGGAGDAPLMLAMLDGAVAWLAAYGRTGQWGAKPWSDDPRRVESDHRHRPRRREPGGRGGRAPGRGHGGPRAQGTARCVSAHARPELGRNALTALATGAARVHGHRDWPVSATHGPVTVNVATFQSGSQPNLVPDRAELRLDVRTVPVFRSDDAVAVISELCGDGIELQRLVDLPGVATDPAAPGMPEVLELLAPGSSPGAPEYADPLHRCLGATAKLGGPAVVVYGPGDTEQAHVTNETCSVDRIGEAAEALYRLLRAAGR